MSERLRIGLFVNAETGGDLEGGKSDVSRIYQVMVDENVGCCDRTSTKTLEDCSSESKFLEILKKQLKRCGPNNQFIFYYSGHGEIVNKKFCISFGKSKELLAFDSVIDRIIIEGVKSSILILDACQSGASIKTGEKSSSNEIISMDKIPDGIAILASCTKNQLSREHPKTRESIFTSLLYEGIDQGLGGIATPSGFITIEQIASYIERRLAEKEYERYDFVQDPVVRVDCTKGVFWIAKNKSGAVNDGDISNHKSLDIQYANKLQWGDQPCLKAPVFNTILAEIDWENVLDYANKIKKNISNTPNIEDLKFLKILSPPYGEKYFTNSGILSFFNNPHENYFPNATIIFVKHTNADKRHSEEFFGNVRKLSNAILDKILDNLDKYTEPGASAERTEIYDIPKDIIREAISNALVHRNYNSNSKVIVYLTEDFLEIRNPGNFGSLEIDQILLKGPSPKDSSLASYARNLNVYENIGEGFRLFNVHIQQYGESSIEFELEGTGENTYVRLRLKRLGPKQHVQENTIYISNSSSDMVVAKKINELLNDAGYNTVLQKRDFGSKNYLSLFNKIISTNSRVLALLSPDFFFSDYCLNEVYSCLSGDPLNEKSRLVPVRIEECRPKGILESIPYIDLVPFREDENDAVFRNEILAALEQNKVSKVVEPKQKVLLEKQKILHAEVHSDPNFIARADVLQRLKSYFSTQQGAALTVVISAMGGVGKTALAKEYGWLFRKAYSGIWWVTADSQENIQSSLLELGAMIMPGLEQVEDRERAVQLTLKVLASEEYDNPWLLIYDDVGQKSDLTGLVPEDNVHILITSRLDNWQGYAEKIDLELFSVDEATDFLLKLTSLTDNAGAAKLAEILGCLPLALEQAAVYCRVTGFDEYIKTYSDFLKRPPQGMKYPKSIWKTFTIAIEKVIHGDEGHGMHACPGVFKVLGPLAYLASNEIPLDIFPSYYLSKVERASIVTALSEVSLLKAHQLVDGTQGISLHCLIQEVVRDLLEESGEAELNKSLATTFVADSFSAGDLPLNEVRLWPQVQKLEAHVRSLLRFAPNQGNASEKTSFLLKQYGLYLRSRSEYSAAEPLYRRALAIDEEAFGPKDPKVARSLNYLGELLKAASRYKEAELLYRQALVIDEEALGQKHPSVAMDLNNLAELMRATGNYRKAEPLYRRALKIDEEVFGHYHQEVARKLNNFAELLQTTGRYTDAEPMIRRALSISEEVLGAKHPDVARALNSLAGLLRATGRSGEAEQLYRRALSIDEEMLGLEHPNVARSLNNLAELLRASRRYDEAEPLYRRALTIGEATHGSYHTHVAIHRENLAGLLQSTERCEEAEPLYRQSLSIYETVLGKEHPKVATALNNLALLLKETDRPEEAKALLMRALNIFEVVLGKDHPNVERVRQNLKDI